MTANNVDPGDWPSIVERIRSGDPTIGAYLANRERRQDNYFSEFRYRPTITQNGGGSCEYSTSTYAIITRIGSQVYFQFTFSPSGTQVDGAQPEVYISLPQGYDAAVAAQGSTFVCGFSWWSHAMIVEYLVGGVVFETANKRLSTFPTGVAYTSPPVYGLASQVATLGIFASWTLPDGLV